MFGSMLFVYILCRLAVKLAAVSRAERQCARVEPGLCKAGGERCLFWRGDADKIRCAVFHPLALLTDHKLQVRLVYRQSSQGDLISPSLPSSKTIVSSRFLCEFLEAQRAALCVFVSASRSG